MFVIWVAGEAARCWVRKLLLLPYVLHLELWMVVSWRQVPGDLDETFMRFGEERNGET